VGRCAAEGVARLGRTAEQRGIGDSSAPQPTRSPTVADLVFVLATVAFFALVTLFAKGVAKL
jgi:hypothetical protein